MAGLEIRLSDVLAGGLVVPGMKCRGVEGALEQLLMPLLEREGLSDSAVRAVCEAVQNRERAGCTSVGTVALPHARVSGLNRIVAGLGTNPEGIFEDGGEVRLVLAFATPAQAAVEHLRFLARAAQIFRDDEARTRLLWAADADAILQVIRAREAGLETASRGPQLSSR